MALSPLGVGGLCSFFNHAIPAMLIISAFMLAKCFYYTHYYMTLAKWAVAVYTKKEEYPVM